MTRGKASIIVMGSLRVDFHVRLPREPSDGETLVVQAAGLDAGGKALNQAAGVRRLGGKAYLVGRVGDDVFGKVLLAAVRREKLSRDGIAVDRQIPTGTALPIAGPGHHYVLYVPGANQALQTEEVSARLEAQANAQMLLLQGEVNREANLVAALWAKEHGCTVVLDPAPAEAISEDLLLLADYVTPNLAELAQLTNSEPARDVSEAIFQTDTLFARHSQLTAVAATLGPWGAYVASRQGHFHVEAGRVLAQDTTAAGDAFNAALAVTLADEGGTIRQAVERGVLAGTFACQIPGALPSLPHRDDLVGW